MDFSKYVNKLPYPRKPTKPRLSSSTPSAAEISEYAEKLKGFEQEENEYKENLRKYLEEDRRLNDLFKQDLFKELGIEKHPKKDKIFSFAWELGHSSGLSTVASCADEIVEKLFEGECKWN